MKLKELNERKVATSVGAHQGKISKYSNMALMTVNGRAAEVRGSDDGEWACSSSEGEY
jgi:hypothetical protein